LYKDSSGFVLLSYEPDTGMNDVKPAMTNYL